MPVFNGKIDFIDVFEPNKSLTIKGLMPYTTYGITVSAFTEGGFGVLSKHKNAGNYELLDIFHMHLVS